MPKTVAGFPLTSIVRRSSWRTVTGAELGAGPFCGQAGGERTAVAAKAEPSKARRDSIIGFPSVLMRHEFGQDSAAFYFVKPSGPIHLNCWILANIRANVQTF